MTAANKARVLTRWGAVGLMATAVLTATAGGFAQSYAGLYNWAKEHGLSGWKADSFPLLVDLFIIVGELGLFLLALDAYVVRRKRIMSWLDFFLPLFIALAGWTASLIFNVGHVMNHEFSYQATAAVPPIVSMLGLFVLLRTMHRYVSSLDAEQEEQAREQHAIAAPAPITLQHITVVPLRISAQPAAKEPSAISSPKAQVAAPPDTPGAQREAAPATTVEAKPVSAAEPVKATAPASTSANGTSVNGRPSVSTEPSPVWSDPDDTAIDIPAVSQPDPETLRAVVIDVLGRHHGDVAATMEELRSEGYVVEKDSVQKTRENHWFPYAVYRLLARHLGDGDLVRQDLAAQGIEFDPEALDALVRSWRG
jgi:hypothetical protein